MSKIWEIFSYLNEEMIADIRIRQSKADKIIVIESNFTFSGLSKEFCFPRGKYEKVCNIRRMRGCIRPDAWENETNQNNAALAHILDGGDMQDDDIVICSDCDEVPNWKCLEKIINGSHKFDDIYPAFRLGMTHHKYRFNLIDPNLKWEKAGVCTGKAFKQRNFCGIRNWDMAPVIENGGWHLYGIGTDQDFLIKAQSTSHYNDPECVAMQERIKGGASLLQEERGALQRYPEDMLPKGCLDYPQFYEH